MLLSETVLIVFLYTFLDYEQSPFLLLSSSSRGKDIAKAGAGKQGRRTQEGKQGLLVA